MAIEATSPTTVSIVNEGNIVQAVYDKWAFQLQTTGFGCSFTGGASNPPIQLSVVLHKYRNRADGISELSPLNISTDHVAVFIQDAYALAATQPAVAAALQALTEAVANYAGSLGLI